MTKEEALKQAQEAANVHKQDYMVSKKPNGDWCFGRRFWYEQHADGVSHHRNDTEKTVIRPSGLTVHNSQSKAVKIHPPMNTAPWMGRI